MVAMMYMFVVHASLASRSACTQAPHELPHFITATNYRERLSLHDSCSGKEAAHVISIPR